MDIGFMTRPGPTRLRAPLPGFERFFREHYPAVVRIAAGVVGDADLAQDVAQDVFISALRRFPDPSTSDQARCWVRAAAAHLALNTIRGERRRERRQRLSGPLAPPAGPEETVLDAEARIEVRRALSRLPRRAAAVLVLRHNGLSYAEVAEAMNVKVGHVGTMLRRAESALRKELQNASRI
jgi:RNA polymerase sigma-70 factor (ECF subfamily)